MDSLAADLLHPRAQTANIFRLEPGHGLPIILDRGLEAEAVAAGAADAGVGPRSQVVDVGGSRLRAGRLLRRREQRRVLFDFLQLGLRLRSSSALILLVVLVFSDVLVGEGEVAHLDHGRDLAAGWF